MSGYALGATSIAHLALVDPLLVNVVKRAIRITEQDFGVHEGVRSIEVQTEYVRTGVSKTMDSKHLIQPNGYGGAVDLVPYIAGKLRWEWAPIYVVSSAMIQASRELSVPLIWGAIWDRSTRELPTDIASIQRERHEYEQRHAGVDFLDGPHWQLAHLSTFK